MSDQITEKNAAIFALETAKQAFAPRHVTDDLALKAAALEIAEAENHLLSGRLQDASISFMSAASCMVDARKWSEALELLNRADMYADTANLHGQIVKLKDDLTSTRNQNIIIEHDFSNPASDRAYMSQFADDPDLYEKVVNEALQCGGCAFFAPLNADYGICCHQESKHFKETVFEHFGCHAYVHEGWGPHSFTDPPFDPCEDC